MADNEMTESTETQEVAEGQVLDLLEVEATEPVEGLAEAEWFVALADELNSIFVEHEFTSRWALVEGYHAVGKRILEERDVLKQKGISQKQFLAEISQKINRKERSLFYAIAFAQKYPELDSLPEGKNVSWFKIVQKYLPKAPKPEAPKVTAEVEEKEPVTTEEEVTTKPKPQMELVWNPEVDLWQLKLNEHTLTNFDVVHLQRQLEDYLRNLK